MSPEMIAALKQMTLDYLTMFEEMNVTDPEQMLEAMCEEIREELISLIEQNL